MKATTITLAAVAALGVLALLDAADAQADTVTVSVQVTSAISYDGTTVTHNDSNEAPSFGTVTVDGITYTVAMVL